MSTHHHQRYLHPTKPSKQWCLSLTTSHLLVPPWKLLAQPLLSRHLIYPHPRTKPFLKPISPRRLRLCRKTIHPYLSISNFLPPLLPQNVQPPSPPLPTHTPIPRTPPFHPPLPQSPHPSHPRRRPPHRTLHPRLPPLALARRPQHDPRHRGRRPSSPPLHFDHFAHQRYRCRGVQGCVGESGAVDWEGDEFWE